jgi:hypothetical protein
MVGFGPEVAVAVARAEASRALMLEAIGDSGMLVVFRILIVDETEVQGLKFLNCFLIRFVVE